jgi:hypothetical protein
VSTCKFMLFSVESDQTFTPKIQVCIKQRYFLKTISFFGSSPLTQKCKKYLFFSHPYAYCINSVVTHVQYQDIAGPVKTLPYMVTAACSNSSGGFEFHPHCCHVVCPRRLSLQPWVRFKQSKLLQGIPVWPRLSKQNCRTKSEEAFGQHVLQH